MSAFRNKQRPDTQWSITCLRTVQQFYLLRQRFVYQLHSGNLQFEVIAVMNKQPRIQRGTSTNGSTTETMLDVVRFCVKPRCPTYLSLTVVQVWARVSWTLSPILTEWKSSVRKQLIGEIYYRPAYNVWVLWMLSTKLSAQRGTGYVHVANSALIREFNLDIGRKYSVYWRKDVNRNVCQMLKYFQIKWKI